MTKRELVLAIDAGINNAMREGNRIDNSNKPRLYGFKLGEVCRVTVDLIGDKYEG